MDYFRIESFDEQRLFQDEFLPMMPKRSGSHRPHFFFVKKSPIPKISFERTAPETPALERRATSDGGYKQWRKMG